MNKLKQIRKEKKITLEQLSKQTGISRQAISRMENKCKSLDNLVKLFDALGIEIQLIIKQ